MLGGPLPSAGIAAAHSSQSRARSHQNRSGLTRVCRQASNRQAPGGEAWIDSRRTTPGEEYAPQHIEITEDRSGDTCLNKRSCYPFKAPGGVIALTGNETSAVGRWDKLANREGRCDARERRRMGIRRNGYAERRPVAAGHKAHHQ